MSLTLTEFQTAMETYGANELCPTYRDGEFYSCYNVSGIYFFHSSFSVLVPHNDIPKETMNAIDKLGGNLLDSYSKHKYLQPFYCEDLASIKKLFMLLTLLNKTDYDEELVNELTNKCYKKLFSLIPNRKNAGAYFVKHPQKIDKLYTLLDEYYNLVQPFGNDNFVIKEAITDILDISLDIKCHFFELLLSNSHTELVFKETATYWYYSTMSYINDGYISITHLYKFENNYSFKDEIVYLTANTGSYINLQISLKSGLIWFNSNQRNAKPITNDDIKLITSYLKTTIDFIKSEIVCKIFDI